MASVDERIDERAALIGAFRHAVDGEKRFGINPAAYPDLEERWAEVIDLIERICRKIPPRRKL